LNAWQTPRSGIAVVRDEPRGLPRHGSPGSRAAAKLTHGRDATPVPSQPHLPIQFHVTLNHLLHSKLIGHALPAGAAQSRSQFGIA